MAVFLKCTRFFRLSSVHLQARFNCTKQGIVLGVYSDKGKPGFDLTSTAKKCNQYTKGKLCESLELVDGHLGLGKAFIFWGLVPNYTAVAVVGLGTKNKGINGQEQIDEDKEAVRIAASAGCKTLQNAGIGKIEIDDMDHAESAAEGSILGLWEFQECKKKQKNPPSVELYSLCDDANKKAQWKFGISKGNAQNLARKLTDMPSNLMTPSIFADYTTSILKSSDVRVEIRDQAWIECKFMNAFLAVAKGSNEPPKFIELAYSKTSKVRPIVLVGKGVTFDSGGISIKSSKAMDEMRGDMGGAATCLAAIKCIAESDIDINVRVLLPLCENMPSSKAVKPGDVVKAVNGKTICINNTDAEGRLILADALCYSAEFDPKFIVSIATLTGAMRMALGDAATGVFSTSDSLYKKMMDAGISSGDRVWRFPFWKQYSNEITKQAGYDVNNMGKGTGGGACIAAAFLKEFVPEGKPYMHMDIASVFGPKSDIPYLHKGMTGRPTRTLIDFLRMCANC